MLVLFGGLSVDYLVFFSHRGIEDARFIFVPGDEISTGRSLFVWSLFKIENDVISDGEV